MFRSLTLFVNEIVVSKNEDEKKPSTSTVFSATITLSSLQYSLVYQFPSTLCPGVGLSSTAQSMLSRPMQRKLVTLVHCQLVEEEGRVRAMRAARSLGERTVTELILQHQNPQQLSSNLWAAVRARGCQFLGPGRSFLIAFKVRRVPARFCLSSL